MLLRHVSVFVEDAQNYSTLLFTSLFKNANKLGGGKHERLTVKKIHKQSIKNKTQNSIPRAAVPYVFSYTYLTGKKKRHQPYSKFNSIFNFIFSYSFPSTCIPSSSESYRTYKTFLKVWNTTFMGCRRRSIPGCGCQTSYIYIDSLSLMRNGGMYWYNRRL